jgi:hypothetical protein
MHYSYPARKPYKSLYSELIAYSYRHIQTPLPHSFSLAAYSGFTGPFRRVAPVVLVLLTASFVNLQLITFIS